MKMLLANINKRKESNEAELIETFANIAYGWCW